MSFSSYDAAHLLAGTAYSDPNRVFGTRLLKVAMEASVALLWAVLKDEV